MHFTVVDNFDHILQIVVKFSDIFQLAISLWTQCRLRFRSDLLIQVVKPEVVMTAAPPMHILTQKDPFSFPDM